MKRFYRDAKTEAVEGGWRVTLDGRMIKTAMGTAQIVPHKALADALAEEWAGQPEEIDPERFVLRDLADYAIDVVRPDRESAIEGLLRYAETDTLCYRGDPGEAIHARQMEVWEPLLCRIEARHTLRFERISGVIHHSQPPETLAALRSVLAPRDDFALAALGTLAALSASLSIALSALESGADAKELWAAANLEEDWQAELWGKDAETETRRTRRFAAFEGAMRFARLARGIGG